MNHYIIYVIDFEYLGLETIFRTVRDFQMASDASISWCLIIVLVKATPWHMNSDMLQYWAS